MGNYKIKINLFYFKIRIYLICSYSYLITRCIKCAKLN